MKRRAAGWAALVLIAVVWYLLAESALDTLR